MAEDLPPRGGPRPRPAKPARGGSGTDTGWSVIGTMLSGMAVWGGAGWLLDRWLDTKGFVPVGVLLGMAVAITWSSSSTEPSTHPRGSGQEPPRADGPKTRAALPGRRRDNGDLQRPRARRRARRQQRWFRGPRHR